MSQNSFFTTLAVDLGRPGRIDALLLAIESNTSELHELIVIRKDKDNSKDSGNTSLTEVCFVFNYSYNIKSEGARLHLKLTFLRNLTSCSII